MTITLTCPSCGKEYSFSDDMGGKQGTCSCGAIIDIPVASAPSPFQNISAEPPMGQPPVQQPPGVAGNPVTPNVHISSGGFSTLNFIGHQLFFWAQIGFITGSALILINSIMLFAGEGEGTLNDVGIYITGGASIPCLVGLGFWIGCPKQAQCFGLILTTFITTTAGILLLSIAFLIRAEDP